MYWGDLVYMSGRVDAIQLNTTNVVRHFVQSHSHHLFSSLVIFWRKYLFFKFVCLCTFSFLDAVGTKIIVFKKWQFWQRSVALLMGSQLLENGAHIKTDFLKLLSSSNSHWMQRSFENHQLVYPEVTGWKWEICMLLQVSTWYANSVSLLCRRSPIHRTIILITKELKLASRSDEMSLVPQFVIFSYW